jgi:signal transduction histidine kinase/ligand-binding sensor domain-containing protein/CheY-like chemotaxis protein
MITPMNTNMNILKGYLLAFVFLSTSFFPAYAENWHPVHQLSTANGLPTDGVKQVYQDKDGYIWIATIDGLCRYDGHQLKIYKTNLYTPGLLTSNKINAIAEDDNHNLWIGTTNGLNVLNKITGKIRLIDAKKLGNNNIQVILATKRNEIWIGTTKGLHKYVPEEDTFICYDNVITNDRLRENDIKTLIEDHNGNIWIGAWKGGITRLDPVQSVFYPYPVINPGNSAHVIFEDNNHNLWVGSWGYGLFRLENPEDPQKVRYVNYNYNGNDAGSLSDKIVYALSQDLNTNTLWVGTRSGLSILNDINNPSSFTNYLPNQSSKPLIYNEVNTILRDNAGLMWLGTLGGGLSVINTQENLFNLNTLEEIKNVHSSNSVRSIYIDRDGIIWLGIGSYGLASFNPVKNQYTFYEDHPDFRDNPITSTVNAIIQFRDTISYAFATYGQGIFIYNPKSQDNKVINISDASHPWLNSNIVHSIWEDANQRLWIGTTDGICIYNPKTNHGIAYPHLDKKTTVLDHYVVSCIEEENDNTVWLTTESGGAFKVTRDTSNPDTLHFFRYYMGNGKLNNDNVQYIYKDSRGRLWLGSEGGGLSLYNKDMDAFVSVQQKYGIPGDIVYCIIEDDDSDLWMGTNAGLSVLKFSQAASDEKVVCHYYTVSDGLQGNSFNRNAIFKTPEGELYFGGHKGYNRFYPHGLYERNLVSKVVITDIKISNQSLEVLDDKLRETISPNTPGYTSRICLPYNHNNLSIEFAALSYSNSMQNKYAYRLNGFDKDWQYTDAAKRFTSYNNLKSGTYYFQLKSSNGSGIWNEMGTELKVVILPPPWSTWWAYLIYLIVAMALVLFTIAIVRNKILVKNTIRLKDIEKQKTEELNQAKLQFFTNITHEFLTPLTILSASVDELKILSPQHNEFYAVMSNNIKRLIRLLQQILEFRKAETGNLKLKVSKGDIAAFVKASVDNFSPLIKKNKIHFSLICDPETIPAYFDNDKLDKILFNLLSNAAKYNKTGGFVQVNLVYASDDKNSVLISVRDNGEGIKPQALKDLFKRFYEGDYRHFNTIGTGIGLSLTKDLIELHKGEITVESEVGKGTVFYVKLPVSSEFYGENEIDDYTYMLQTITSDTPEKDTPEQPEQRKEYSLLIIEDNEELLQLMVKLLSKEYNVYTAQNGKEGITILEEKDIDLAVSDIMMPEMDGIEFCKYVKNKFEISHVPIILLTAKNKEEDRIEAYDFGADGFISKPFNLNVLYSKIKNLLKSKAKAAKEFKKQFVFEVKSLNYTNVDEKFLQQAIDCVNGHINDPDFDQQQFADALGTSKSTLYKKLKSLTDLNTSAFIRNIRLKTVCKIIEENRKIRISELAYAVGFSDPKYFSSCFKKEFGLIPSEYLDKILEEKKKGSNEEKKD